MKQHRLTLWTLYVSLSALVLLVFALVGQVGGRGTLLMPLDDVYIHFQYTRQMVQGEAYIYNPGGDPTSGATSFLYPFLLAPGYVAGFQGLTLGWWALILGTLSLLASLVAVHRLAGVAGAPRWMCVVTAVAFALGGFVPWHYMSGMETGIVVALSFWTLLGLAERRLPVFIISVSLLALIRPEGGIMALMAVAAMALRLWTQSKRQIVWLLIPLAMPLLQPLVNNLITGTAVASGSQAKSLLAMVPPDPQAIIEAVLGNWLRMWREWLMGDGAFGIWYLPPLLGLMALAGLVWGLFSREIRITALLILGWLLIISVAISTLDTAFWHCKRYQMPLMSTFYPLAAWAGVFLWRSGRLGRLLTGFVTAYILIAGALIAVQFVRFHAINVDYVYRQPYSMARWLAENAPADARVAVHDVGMMRYVGERETLDMVGLTTPGAAAYWRSGPGAVGEWLIDQRPDLIASYGRGHGFGLALLADTSLYGETLAMFDVHLRPEANVALAAAQQGIYRPDWSSAEAAKQPQRLDALPDAYQFEIRVPVFTLNVADIASENHADYNWSSEHLPGFPTELRELRSAGGDGELVLDGGRALNGEESFTVTGLDPELGALLITRVHSSSAGSLEIYANDALVARRVLIALPGEWLELATLIPSDLVREQTVIRVVPLADTVYQPYRHWVYSIEAPDLSDPDAALASYQNGAFFLLDIQTEQQGDLLLVDLRWLNTGEATGNYRLFVHLYDNVDQPPVAQWDGYLAGSLPPGNWLPGVREDRIVVDLDAIPPGRLELAIGFYDPQTFNRLEPANLAASEVRDGRLFIGEIAIGE